MTKKVIIAEDFAPLRNAYLFQIELMKEDKILPADLEVECVANGESLIEKVKNEKYLLILTDNDMPPGITGLEAIKKIREFDKDVPIYMISGSAFQSLKSDALKYGATGFIDKGELKTRLESLLKQYLE